MINCILLRFQRHAGPLVTAAVAILSFLSPIAMVAIPRTNLIDLTERQLRCEVGNAKHSSTVLINVVKVCLK